MLGWTPETLELAALALAKFDHLSESELKLLCAATTGEFAFCGPSTRVDDQENDSTKAAGWGDERTIRAALLRWLCLDGTARILVDPRGIVVHAAKIADELDLSFATVPFPLAFMNCHYAVDMSLLGAQLQAFSLFASRTKAIMADGLKVRGNLLFRNGNAEGEVRLLGADVGGIIDCRNGKFNNAGAIALAADGLKGGDVYLRYGFSVDGEVRLLGAAIRGNLECDGAEFASDTVVSLEQASVAGSFMWRNVRWNLESKRDAEADSLPKQRPSVRLNLQHTTVGPMADDKNSWPPIGTLLLDGFVYARIGAGPRGAKSRLEWLSRQGDRFWPQPYQQLAKVLREAGDDSGARSVLVAMENSRRKYGKLPWSS
jgi:hypothetical protein